MVRRGGGQEGRGRGEGSGGEGSGERGQEGRGQERRGQEGREHTEAKEQPGLIFHVNDRQVDTRVLFSQNKEPTHGPIKC